ncbi:MAG: hypothetical protein AAGK97_17840 [Bacteroidota bacterium]
MKLNAMYGFSKALEYGFLPFWKGGIIKSVSAAICVYGYFKFRRNNIQNA